METVEGKICLDTPTWKIVTELINQAEAVETT